jgi:regulator of ribonuclease activity A
MPGISTPDLCDQFGDSIQVLDPMLRHFGAVQNFGGEVATVKCFEDNSLVAETVATPGRGRVLVVDGGGSPHRSLLGDNLAGTAIENGWAGIIIYGAIRDVEEITSMQLGVMAIASFPRKTVKRGQGQTEVSISFASVTVKPGDYIYADLTGVIVADRKLV